MKTFKFWLKEAKKAEAVDNPGKNFESDNVNYSYHLYPLQIDFNKLPLSKVEFFEKMKEVGINLQVHYIPVHLQPFYQKNYGFNTGDFPVSESFYMNEVSLPIYPDLTLDEQARVVEKLNYYFNV